MLHIPVFLPLMWCGGQERDNCLTHLVADEPSNGYKA